MGTLLVVVFGIFVSGFFSGIETGCYTLSRLKLLYKVNKGDKDAKILYKLIADPQKFVFMSLICQNIFVNLISMKMTGFYSNILYSEKSLPFLFGFLPLTPEVLATLTLVIPIFIFGEVGPKNVFLYYADILMYNSVRLLNFLCKTLAPFIIMLKFFADLLLPKKEEVAPFEFVLSKKLRYIFVECHKNGVINRFQNSMINCLIKLQQISISNLMIPLDEVFALPLNSYKKSCLSELRGNTGFYSDIPVYIGEKENIIGIIDFFDLLDVFDNKTVNIKDKIKKIAKIPTTLTIDETFAEFQRIKDNKAAVVDIKGKIVGLIYFEDIISYITKKGKKDEVYKGKTVKVNG